MLSTRCKISFVEVGGAYEPLPLTKAYQEISEWVQCGSGEAAVGANAADEAADAAGEVTLYWIAADLFPKHAEGHTDESFRGIVQPSREFLACIQWALNTKDSKDVLLIADGRSETVRKSIRRHRFRAGGKSPAVGGGKPASLVL